MRRRRGGGFRPLWAPIPEMHAYVRGTPIFEVHAYKVHAYI
jgi:hypothetical protein